MSEPLRDPDLRALAETYRDLQKPASEACPAAEALAQLAIEGGTETSPLAEHVLGCRRCSDDLQILFRTHAEASRQNAGPTVRLRLYAVAAIAAVVAIAIAGVLLVNVKRSSRVAPAGEVERGEITEVASRIEPRESSALDRAPEEFAWPAQRNAEGYRVKLFDRAGNSIWETEAGTDTRVAFPAERRSLLARGEYFWVVEVGPAADRKRLGPFRFSIR